MTDCLFCKIIAGDIPAETLYQDDDILAFRDISPQAPHHFLIIPKKHLSGPAAITADEEELFGKMMRVGAELAAQHGIGEGFRVVLNNGEQAGQTVFHLHMHILGGRPMTWPPG
jgi:histidine triad (HIT) family protein